MEQHRDIFALCVSLGLVSKNIYYSCSLDDVKKSRAEFDSDRERNFLQSSSYDYTVELARPFKDEYNLEQQYKFESSLKTGNLF